MKKNERMEKENHSSLDSSWEEAELQVPRKTGNYTKALNIATAIFFI